MRETRRPENVSAMLPLAVEETEIGSTLIIDPTEVLARALIRETYPERMVQGSAFRVQG